MMSTSTSTSVNVPVSTNSIQLNPYDYINKGMNEIIIEYFSYMNPEKKKSIKTLFFGIGILITADITKNIIQNFTRENSKHINDFLMCGFRLISFENLYNISIYMKNTIQFKFNIFKYFRNENNEIIKFDENFFINNTHRIEVNLSKPLLQNLLIVIDDNNDNNIKISYDNQYDDVLTYQDNSNKSTFTKNINNIRIKYDILNIEIDKISYNNNSEIVSTNNNLMLLDILTKEYIEFKNSGIYDILLVSLENIPIKSMLTIKYGKYQLIFNSIIKFTLYNIKVSNDSSLVLPSKLYGEIILNKAFEGFSIESFINYFDNNTNKNLLNIILINITALYIIELLTLLDNNINFKNEMSKILNDKQYNSNSKFINFFSEAHYKMFIYNSNLYNRITLLLKSLYSSSSIFKNIINFIENESIIDNEKNTDSNINKLIFNVSCDETNDKLIIYKKLDNFFEYISNMSKRITNGDKINIYTLTITSKSIIEKSDNQEYIKYGETKKVLIEEKKSLEDIIKLIGIEPNKYIETSTIQKEVQINLINNKFCSFENLYLRKGQDNYLFDIVQSFLNDKKLMSDLGIPNKLGILLYGEPGCGKTTTILTIASFFKRDIFYINLKAIHTNEELKMAFDYANSKHSNGGGIIIIEDIDAMSDIVHNRTNKTLLNNTLNELIDSTDNSITLEYLLNLLDGTLTYDNSIVIITTNHIEKLDPALYRAGRMDNLIEMKKCDHYQISRIYKRFIQRDLDKKILELIPEDKYTPAEIIFHLKLWIKKRNEKDDIIMKYFIT